MLKNPTPPPPCPNCHPPPPDMTHPQFVPGHGWTATNLHDRNFDPRDVPGLEGFPQDLAARHVQLSVRRLRKLPRTELALRCYSPNRAINYLARQGMQKRGWNIPPPGTDPYRHRRKVVAAEQRPIPEPSAPAMKAAD